MAVKILLISLLYVAVASANSCCRGYKILQFRRPGLLPMYDSSSHCGNMYNHQENYCEGPLYPTEPISKYDSPVSRYYPPYMEPKAITHKCVCSKSIESQRIVSNIPRYYKRRYCSDPMMDGHCDHYACGQYGDCGQYAPCASYGQCAPCAPSCGMSSSLFRQPPHRVLPLTLPASCVC